MLVPLWKIEAASALTGIGSVLSKCLMRPYLVVQEYIRGNIHLEK